jgi:hypothetical protein
MSDAVVEMPETMTGGCMCRAVRYRISGRPVVAGLCHCNRCQPQSGSAFSTVINSSRAAACAGPSVTDIGTLRT